MSKHQHYYELEADSYRELGLRRGEMFGEFLRRTLNERREDRDWNETVARAQEYLAPAGAAFPQYVDELKGYAEAANAPFGELWALSLEDEVTDESYERCTTVVTNHGALIAHNEDWDDDAEDQICVVSKRVGNLRSFELYYLNTLGGNSISINSNGYVHAINSLSHTDGQIGVPKNLVARWLSETRSPDSDYEKLTELRRASGYHHTLVSLDGRIWSIECSATEQKLLRPTPPFIHTNHFLTDLRRFEGRRRDLVPGTRTRYETAEECLEESMDWDDVEELVSDTSEGDDDSVFNERTIARMIVDVRHMEANVWLSREENKGWLTYDLRPIFRR
jgi:hypothetical protein